MTSIIYFKFRAMKAYESLMFDGHFLSVKELKQLIADKRGLVGGTAGELVLSEPPEGPELADDAQIPKGAAERSWATRSLAHLPRTQVRAFW